MLHRYVTGPRIILEVAASASPLTAHTYMQAQFQKSYADSSADELLGVLHQLDVDRLHAALQHAMGVQSGEHIQHQFLKQSHVQHVLAEPCTLQKKETCPPSAVYT